MKYDDITSQIRSIEKSYDYHSHNNKYDVLVDLDEMAKLIQKIQVETINSLEQSLRAACEEHMMGISEETNIPIYAHPDKTWHDFFEDFIGIYKKQHGLPLEKVTKENIYTLTYDINNEKINYNEIISFTRNKGTTYVQFINSETNETIISCQLLEMSRPLSITNPKLRTFDVHVMFNENFDDYKSYKSLSLPKVIKLLENYHKDYLNAQKEQIQYPSR